VKTLVLPLNALPRIEPETEQPTCIGVVRLLYCHNYPKRSVYSNYNYGFIEKSELQQISKFS
jgi:hypothetical protein